ncbi:unknown protein [Seminavis robusta]|uniref:Uncharacterized protein n=1 Tax=Seminavis robusta TaxID=568900 RepID=A0A9N8F459_9STRA|nr:unknown protein [Seminavis robusta]|eukprot:Sro3914_g351870.1 n/a (306) ;mRNA; f:2565-3482
MDKKDEVHQFIQQSIQNHCTNNPDIQAPIIVPLSRDDRTVQTQQTRATKATTITKFDFLLSSTVSDQTQQNPMNTTRPSIPTAIVATNSYAAIVAGAKSNQSDNESQSNHEGDAVSHMTNSDAASSTNTAKTEREQELEDTIDDLMREKNILRDVNKALQTELKEIKSTLSQTLQTHAKEQKELQEQLQANMEQTMQQKLDEMQQLMQQQMVMMIAASKSTTESPAHKKSRRDATPGANQQHIQQTTHDVDMDPNEGQETNSNDEATTTEDMIGVANLDDKFAAVEEHDKSNISAPSTGGDGGSS